MPIEMDWRNEPQRKDNPLAGLLLGLFLLAIGALVYWTNYDHIRQWRQMRHWVEASAQILEASLETQLDDDNVAMYRVLAKYRYFYEGKQYTGTRVDIEKGPDNIDSYHHDMVLRLEQAMRTETKIPCYVNPANPEEAILSRSLRISVILFTGVFLVLFGGLGLVFFSGGLSSLYRRWVQQRGEWRTGVISANVRTRTITRFMFALIYNTIAMPVGYMMLLEVLHDGTRWRPEMHWDPRLLVLVFPLVGLLLFGVTLWGLVRSLRRTVVFRMAPVPGTLGGMVGGVVEIPGKLPLAKGACIDLACLTTGRYKNETTSRTYWKQRQSGVVDLMPGDPHRTYLPVQFSPPYNGLQSSESSDEARSIDWVLTVTIPDCTWQESFHIPVFRTAASRKDFVPAASSSREAGRTLSASELMAENYSQERIVVCKNPGGIRIVYLPLRYRGGLLALTAVDVLLWLGTILLGAYGPIFLTVFCGLFSLLLVIPILNLAFVRHEIIADAGHLIFQSSSMHRRSRKVLAWEQVSSVELSAGLYFFGTQYWQLQVITTSGVVYHPGGMIESRQAAEALQARLTKVRKTYAR